MLFVLITSIQSVWSLDSIGLKRKEYICYGQDGRNLLNEIEDKVTRSKFIRFLFMDLYAKDRLYDQDSITMIEQIDYGKYEQMPIRNVYFGELKDYRRTEDDKLVYIPRHVEKSVPLLLLAKKAIPLKEGVLYTSVEAFESKRILRSYLLYRYAQLVVQPSADGQYVDLFFVLTFKKFIHYAFTGFPIRDIPIGYAFVDFLHQNQSLAFALRANYQLINPIGFRLDYDLMNLFGSKIWFDLSTNIDVFTREVSLVLERDYWSVKDPVAAGIGIDWMRDARPEHVRIFSRQNVWLSIGFNGKKIKQKFPFLRGFASFRFQNEQTHFNLFNDNPVLEDTVRRQYIAALGLYYRNFYVEKDVFVIGEYEYLPRGTSFAFIGGGEEIKQVGFRAYLGFRVFHGVETKKQHYIYNQFAIGGFLNPFSLKVQDLAFRYSIRFITKRYMLGRWAFRQLLYNNVQVLFNQNIERLTLDQSVRLPRPFDALTFYSCYTESTFYSPLDFLGWQANMYMFTEFGLGNNAGESVKANNIFHVLGLGFRFRHRRLGIPYIDFSFGIVTTPLSNEGNYDRIEVTEENFRAISEERIYIPSIIDF